MKPFSIFKEMLRQSCVDIYINQYATLIQGGTLLILQIKNVILST